MTGLSMDQSIFRKAAEKAKKWQQLEELLRDDEIVGFLAKEFSSVRQAPQPPRANGTPTRPQISASSAYKRGDALRTVKHICGEFLPLSPFTAADVKAKMDERGFLFAAQDPSITVRGSLRKLVKRGIIRVHTVGTGRAPNKYEVPPKD